MVAHQVQKRFVAHEFASAKDGVAIPARLGLVDEAEAPRMLPGHPRVGRLVARQHHHTEVLDLGLDHLFDQDAEHRFLLAVRSIRVCSGRFRCFGAAAVMTAFLMRMLGVPSTQNIPVAWASARDTGCLTELGKQRQEADQRRSLRSRFRAISSIRLSPGTESRP